MLEFTYFATRALKAGVTLGDEITLTLKGDQSPAQDVDNLSGGASLGGRKQYNLLSSVKSWNIKITKTDGVDYSDLQMFVQSIKGGEIFVYTDIDNSESYPVQKTSSVDQSRIVRHLIQDFNYSMTIEQAVS